MSCGINRIGLCRDKFMTLVTEVTQDLPWDILNHIRNQMGKQTLTLLLTRYKYVLPEDRTQKIVL